MAKRAWPPWWAWELKFDRHVFGRMVRRHFNEVDLRVMLEDATGFRRDVEEGRWLVEVRHYGCRWEVVIEPEFDTQLLWVITAYEARSR